MALKVRDRVGEVGVMRALGFTPPHVAILLAVEAGAIGLLGGAIGAAVALWYFGAGVSLGRTRRTIHRIPKGGVAAKCRLDRGARVSEN